ncbi:MAG: pyruvate dehydrogenase E2 component [Geobacteraceae bacterium]|nr:MAG: pyruvate dehydrogenase E2 component [Geobacteraceae bacterium]
MSLWLCGKKGFKMATEITMPKLSDTMTEGRLVSWKKSVGERVERGDIIAEVETDKANMELEAFASGVLLETRVKAGDLVPVGTVIGIIGEAGEAVAVPPAGAAVREAEAAKEKPIKEIPAEKEKLPPEEPKEAVSPPVQPVEAAEAVEIEKASPLVRRLAREQGIDLKLVKGSGPEGRILQEDLERFIKERESGTGTREQEKAKVQQPPVGGTQPLSRMRAAIARTVSEAWRTIPHFAVTDAIEMGEAERMRRELKEAGTPLTINDLIVKAAAMALAKFPLVNASFAGDGILLHGEVNIGIAVGLEEGLLVPVIKGCQNLSLRETAEKSRALIALAQSGRISETDIAGGTFSISNLGMFGVEEFMAVILPPQGAILAVGAIIDQPAVKDGRIVPIRMMKATLSADHRLLDGLYAARFMAELKRVLENPVVMLV